MTDWLTMSRSSRCLVEGNRICKVGQGAAQFVCFAIVDLCHDFERAPEFGMAAGGVKDLHTKFMTLLIGIVNRINQLNIFSFGLEEGKDL